MRGVATSQTTAREMERIADEVIILEIPTDFRAVAQVYENWYDVSDEEVLEITRREESKILGNEV